MKTLLIIIFASLLIFLPSYSNFFAADDWFHLKITQITSPQEFINFFSFVRNPVSITSYRPIPSQLFFFVFQKLFGLDPVPYHLFALSLFALNIALVYHLAREILPGRRLPLLSAILYGVSAVHFTALYSIASIQEIVLVSFALLALYSYHRSGSSKESRWRIASLVFFVLALLSKETAAVLPIIFVALDWAKGRTNILRVIPFFVILIPYLFLRFFVFGGITGGIYQWEFSLKRTLNTTIWYTLWSLGVPEFLVDYVGSGPRLISKYFIDFSRLGWVVLGYTAALVISLPAALAQNRLKRIKAPAFGLFFFFVSLLPVIFLPWHKFTLELGLPMAGMSIFLASLLPKKSTLSYAFVGIFLLSNLFTNWLYLSRHYSVTRATMSKEIYGYFRLNYPTPPISSYFEFVNDTPDYGPEWGSSKQIAQVTSDSNLFKVIYHDPAYRVYFADHLGPRPVEKTKIPISTKMFTDPNL